MNIYQQIYQYLYIIVWYRLSRQSTLLKTQLKNKTRPKKNQITTKMLRFSVIWSSIQQRRWIDTTIFRHFLVAFYFFSGNTTICWAKWSLSLSLSLLIFQYFGTDRSISLYFCTKQKLTPPPTFVCSPSFLYPSVNSILCFCFR